MTHSTLVRALVLIHRYLGACLGPLVVLWCLSGIVMMYVPYPTLSETRRLEALQPLVLDGCCPPMPPDLREGASIERFSIEALDGRPILRLIESDGRAHGIDLLDGRLFRGVSPAQVLAGSRRFSRDGAETPTVDEVAYDQWTVSGAPDSDRPLHRVTLHDAAGTIVYFSGNTGRAIQLTTRAQRFWNWLGAIPHWLYFADLRRNPSLWAKIVVWTSLGATVLVALGVYLGIARMGHHDTGWSSPYRGLLYWHHVPGLLFGALALTWTASGFLSMNPWGLLSAEDMRAERVALEGTPMSLGEIEAAVAAAARAGLGGDVVSIESTRLNGVLYLVARTSRGSRTRLDAAARPAPLSLGEWTTAARALGAETSVLDRLDHGDDYYFAHHDDVAFPVYRLIRDDEDHTRYYIDPITGEILRKVGPNSRRYRWLHEGFHRLDFTEFLRSRPIRDFVVLSLLAGVSVVCATGAWLGVRRWARSA